MIVERGIPPCGFKSLPGTGNLSSEEGGLPLPLWDVSDGQGFEPWVPMKEHTLSKRAQSTALPPILGICQLSVDSPAWQAGRDAPENGHPAHASNGAGGRRDNPSCHTLG